MDPCKRTTFLPTYGPLLSEEITSTRGSWMSAIPNRNTGTSHLLTCANLGCSSAVNVSCAKGRAAVAAGVSITDVIADLLRIKDRNSTAFLKQLIIVSR